jgi:hypothetical protein
MDFLAVAIQLKVGYILIIAAGVLYLGWKVFKRLYK